MARRVRHTALSERLEFLMKEMGWRKVDLARACEVEASAVGNWVSGRNKTMAAEFAFRLQDKYRWNARWILEGVGPARMKVLDAEDERMIEAIRELPPERRRALATILGF